MQKEPCNIIRGEKTVTSAVQSPASCFCQSIKLHYKNKGNLKFCHLICRYNQSRIDLVMTGFSENSESQSFELFFSSSSYSANSFRRNQFQPALSELAKKFVPQGSAFVTNPLQTLDCGGFQRTLPFVFSWSKCTNL